MNPQIIPKFAEYLKDRGYAAQTIHAYSKALEQAPDTWNTDVPQELYEHINGSLQSKQELFLPSARHNIKPASSLLFLIVTGVSFKFYARQASLQESKYAELLSEFLTYSIEFKHMTKMAAEAEKQHISKFLNSLNRSPDAWIEISATDIRDYVCTEFQNLRTSSMGRYVTSLRNFFRFLEYKGNAINQSVLTLPLAPADWAKSKVPVVLSADEEQRLRRHYSAEHESGVRNNIIILLMLDLGLRCAEVSDLSLADIHWSNGTIRLCKTKNMQIRELPFSCELGALLEDYVLNYRPRVPDSHLLLRKVLNNQYTSMTRESVRGVVRRAYEKENIQGWWKGTHALRRTAASKIYRAGNGLKLTADLLGHESLDSIKSYIRVDFQQLKEVIFPWPGGDIDES